MGGGRSELPGVTRLGCSFHLTQAVWRKAQEIGLKPAYVNDKGTHVFIKKILALPFLPSRQIEPIFCSLTKDRDGQWKKTSPQLLELIKYGNGNGSYIAPGIRMPGHFMDRASEQTTT